MEKNKHEGIAGIIGLDTNENNSVIGTELPLDMEKVNWIDLVYKYKMKGDKAYFFDTNIIKMFPFPAFQGNKHMPPSYQYFMMSKKYDFLLLNKNIKYVEYMADGISRNKYRKYYIAPDNFTYYRLKIMDLIPSFRRQIINSVHYNATSYFSKEKFKVEKLKHKILVLLTKPFGFMLYLLIRFKNK